MQKALTQMNLQLANVISDLSGLTGQRIVRAIIAGERDAQRLAGFRDPRVKASQEEIAKSLEGNWRPELIFLLQQEMAMYDTYQQRIAECDQQLHKHLTSFADHAHQVRSQSAQGKAEGKKAKKPAAKNAPRFDLSSELERITGVDLTRIDGIDDNGHRKPFRLSTYAAPRWVASLRVLINRSFAGRRLTGMRGGQIAAAIAASVSSFQAAPSSA